MKADGKRQFELLNRIGFVRVSGTPEELKAANILMDEIRSLGLEPSLEPFEVTEDGVNTEVSFEVVEPVQKKYTVTGYKLSGCTAPGGEVHDFLYLEQFENVMLSKVKDKVVLVNGRVNAENYEKLVKAGAAAFVTMGGTVIDEVEKTDLDTRTMRKSMREIGLMPAFHMRMTDALDMLKSGASKVKISLQTRQESHTSNNVVVEIPGTEHPEEIIDVGAHYDSVPFSYGVWDNGAGSVTIMEMLRFFKENPPKRSMRFIWFGSEELGLLGSHAYVDSLGDEAAQHIFMINVDVGGSVLGGNMAVCTCDDGLCKYVEYLAREVGYSTTVKQDIMSSDSVPFADRGIPAINFGRGGFAPGMGFMHTRYDMISLISPEALEVVTEFAITLAEHIVNSVVFPVPREIPQNIVEKVDKYLNKKPEKK